MLSPGYKSEFMRIHSYINLVMQKKVLLTGCSRNFDPIFDPIIIAKCSQMVIVEYIGEDWGRETSYWAAGGFLEPIWDVLEPEWMQEPVVWGLTMGPIRISQLGRWCQLGFIALRITIGHLGGWFSMTETRYITRDSTCTCN